MKKLGVAVALAAGTLLMTAPAFAQNQHRQGQGQGQAIVTVLPAHEGEQAVSVALQEVKIKLNGKQANVTSWTPFRDPDSRLELVLLIDSGATRSLGEEMGDIRQFIHETPSNTKMAIAYMEDGRAAFAGPLSSNPAEVERGLHLPAGFPGSSASPYFCLSDLAKNWPSTDRTARREVIMISDGVDPYQMQYDPDDPYVQAAIQDSVHAGLVVHAIYWLSQGRANRSGYESSAGQNLLLQLCQSTGGKSYWEGMGNPVSFEPYFKDLRRRLKNQYSLSFTSRLDGKPQVQTMKLQLAVSSAKVDAPQQVLVSPAGGAGE
jgi:hypothetical protein